jgi:hypothetical protein
MAKEPSKHERHRELVTEEVVAVGAPAPVAAMTAVETSATVYEDVRLRLDDILKIPVHSGPAGPPGHPGPPALPDPPAVMALRATSVLRDRLVQPAPPARKATPDLKVPPALRDLLVPPAKKDT